MAATPETMSQLMDQAVETFGGAMKAGIQFQQDIAKWWTEAFDQVGMAQSWQKKGRNLINEAIPAAQQGADEALKLFDQNYRSSMDLMKKAFSAGRADSIPEAQAKCQEMLEASLAAVRTNTEALAQANVKVMKSWAEYMRRTVDATTQPEKPVPVK
jgi:hypothetical protein